MDPDQQLRNVSHDDMQVVALLGLFANEPFDVTVCVIVSLAAAGFSSGLQPHD